MIIESLLGVLAILFITDYICRKKGVKESPSYYLNKFAKWIQNLFSDIGKYITIILSYISLYPLWNYILVNFKFIREFMEKLWSNFVRFARNLWVRFVRFAINIWPRILNFLNNFWKYISEFITDIANIAIDIFRPIIEIIFSPLYILYGYIKEVSGYRYYAILIIGSYLIWISPHLIDKYFNGGYILDIAAQTTFEFMSSINLNFSLENISLGIEALYYIEPLIWIITGYDWYNTNKIGTVIAIYVLMRMLQFMILFGSMSNCLIRDQDICVAYDLIK